MKPIERLYQYMQEKGIRPTRLEKSVGFSNGYLGTQLKRQADIGSGVIEKIIDYCLDLDVEWLLTGKGAMFKAMRNDPDIQSVITTQQIHQYLESQQQIIATHLQTIEEQLHTIEEQNELIATLRKEITSLKKMKEPRMEYEEGFKVC